MGVDMKYIKGVCDAVFPEMDSNVKSSLGRILSKHIDAHEDNSEAGVNIMMVLCNNNDVTMSEGRRAIRSVNRDR